MIKLYWILLLVFSSVHVAGQEYRLEGKLLGEKNQPLIGASILIKGTSIGTVTDINGNFKLKHNLKTGRHEVFFFYKKHKTVIAPFEGRRNKDFGHVSLKKGKGQVRLENEKPEIFAGDKNTQAKFPKVYGLQSSQFEKINWQGKIVNGKADGFGIGTFSKERRVNTYFKGTLEKGVAQGYGEVKSGEKEYACRFVDGVCEGEVALRSNEILPKSSYLVMSVKDGKITGDAIAYSKYDRIESIYKVREIGKEKYEFDSYDFTREQQKGEYLNKSMGAAIGGALLASMIKGGYDLIREAIKGQYLPINPGEGHISGFNKEQPSTEEKGSIQDCVEKWMNTMELVGERDDLVFGNCHPCDEYRIPSTTILGFRSVIYLVKNSSGKWYYGSDNWWSDEGPFETLQEALLNLCNR